MSCFPAPFRCHQTLQSGSIWQIPPQNAGFNAKQKGEWSIKPCLLTGRYPVIWMIHAKTKNRKMLLDLPINIQIFENNCLYNMYSLAKPHFTIQKPFPSINTINGWVITIIPSHGDVLYGNQDESHIKMLFMLFNNRRTDENNFSMSPLRPGDISQRPFLQ